MLTQKHIKKGPHFIALNEAILMAPLIPGTHKFASILLLFKCPVVQQPVWGELALVEILDE